MLGFSAVRKAIVLGVGAVVLGMSGQAHAGLDVVPQQPYLDGSVYRYEFQAFIAGNLMSIRPGDFFTIYDFGPVNSVSMPGGWSFTALQTGSTPGSVTPNDNATTYNLTWTYTGAGITGNASLGTFSATSPYAESQTIFTDIAAQSGRTNVGGNFGDYAGEYAFVPVPEPTSLGLLGLGATAMLARRRSR